MSKELEVSETPERKLAMHSNFSASYYGVILEPVKRNKPKPEPKVDEDRARQGEFAL